MQDKLLTQRAEETFSLVKTEVEKQRGFIDSFRPLSKFMKKYKSINERRGEKFDALVDRVLIEIYDNKGKDEIL